MDYISALCISLKKLRMQFFFTYCLILKNKSGKNIQFQSRHHLNDSNSLVFSSSAAIIEHKWINDLKASL